MRRRTGDQPTLLQLIHEDWVNHGRSFTRAGFHAVAVYRLGAWHLRLPRLFRYPVRVVYGALYFVTRNLYGIELPPGTSIGRRFHIGHQGGIVVIRMAEIGDDVSIRQNVTIGITLDRGGASPKIGDRVDIGAGAVIIGGVTVGEDAIIGPNAVVSRDVPPGGRAFALPARVTGPLGRRDGAAKPGIRETAGDYEDVRERPHAEDVDDLIELIRVTVGISSEIGADSPLLSSGLVDSLNLITLLDALETRYGVTLATEEIDTETFDTPAQILAFVNRSR